MSKLGAVLGIIFFCTAALQATTVRLTFSRVTNNSPEDIASQLSVDVTDEVTDVGADVEFIFRNNGPVMSSISEIYFYDGILLDMSSIDDSCVGVDFEDLGEKVNPKALPGFAPDVSTLEVFSATEAENPESSNGVRPGEWLTIGYTLQSGKSYADLLNDLSTGEIIIGMHVKSIGVGAESDSFVTHPVPEPATICLLSLGGLAALRIRRR